MKFIWETKHLWILLSLIALGGYASWAIRNQFVPATYGDQSGRYGPYRAAALAQIAARPSLFIADSVCHECHEEIQEERDEMPHMAVRCFHCHGVGREHVSQARLAADSPDASIAPAKEWDGDFFTKIDLYVTKDRASCLVCHEEAVGMPEWFQKINVADHLEENEPEDPASREVCWQCHGGHNTEYRELE